MQDIIDPLAPEVPLAQELEILAARRAFSTAQQMLSGRPLVPAQSLTVGWHDSSVSPETGSFAVVSDDGSMDDLIGEIVQVSFFGRVVYAYVLSSGPVPVQLSLTRRLFLALMRLSAESIQAQVAASQ